MAVSILGVEGFFSSSAINKAVEDGILDDVVWIILGVWEILDWMDFDVDDVDADGVKPRA